MQNSKDNDASKSTGEKTTTSTGNVNEIPDMTTESLSNVGDIYPAHYDTNGTSTPEKHHHHHHHEHYKVIIIGAGASGLQCCSTLVHQYGFSINDILILEARDRIGGRVYTTFETPVYDPQYIADSHPINSNGSTFALDHGAAWVHGTGFDIGTTIPTTIEEYQRLNNDDDNHDNHDEAMINPMMYLLQQQALTMNNNTHIDISNNSDNNINENNNNNVYERFYNINPIVDGNPWMRPRSILHNPKRIGLYVAGQYIDHDPLQNTNNHNDHNNNNNTNIIQQALQRHYSILRIVQQIGNHLFNTGRGLETATTSFADSIQQAITTIQHDLQSVETVSNTTNVSDPTKIQQQIAAIAPFYMLLLECWYGCEVSALQLCEFIEDKERICNLEDQTYTKEGDFIGPHCTVQNGMISVLQPLLRNGVQDRILLGQEVTNIEYTNTTQSHNQQNTDRQSDSTIQKCISIRTACGLHATTDTCVVTIPAGCLKDAISHQNCNSNDVFITPLSKEKMEAISYLKMGSYKKVFITFNHIFWPKEPPFLGLIRNIDDNISSNNDNVTNHNNNNEQYYKTQSSHPLGNCLLVDNLWAIRGIASLEVVLFGTAGIWSIHKSDDEICTTILNFMSDAMSIPITSLQQYYVSCHITRWEEDKYSLGAYSSMGLGALESHVEELRRPEWDDRLVFSGEATISEFEGSVYAALYSGMNAAKSIHDFFLNK